MTFAEDLRTIANKNRIGAVKEWFERAKSVLLQAAAEGKFSVTLQFPSDIDFELVPKVVEDGTGLFVRSTSNTHEGCFIVISWEER